MFFQKLELFDHDDHAWISRSSSLSREGRWPGKELKGEKKRTRCRPMSNILSGQDAHKQPQVSQRNKNNEDGPVVSL